MRSRAIPTLPALLVWALVAVAPAAQPAAGASLTFTPCPEASTFSCASLPVPLSRSGNVPGSISLNVRRRLAGSSPRRRVP